MISVWSVPTNVEFIYVGCYNNIYKAEINEFFIVGSLHDIIQDSTRVFRKGEEVEKRRVGSVDVVEIFGYDHTNQAPLGDNFEKVDMIFVDVVVDRSRATQYREALVEQLRNYPQPERLAGGPSYIELAPNLGMEQEGALRFMALGKTLGMWDIMSAKTLGMNDEEARQMAGQGFLMISGYKPSH